MFWFSNQIEMIYNLFANGWSMKISCFPCLHVEINWFTWNSCVIFLSNSWPSTLWCLKWFFKGVIDFQMRNERSTAVQHPHVLHDMYQPGQGCVITVHALDSEHAVCRCKVPNCQYKAGCWRCIRRRHATRGLTYRGRWHAHVDQQAKTKDPSSSSLATTMPLL